MRTAGVPTSAGAGGRARLRLGDLLLVLRRRGLGPHGLQLRRDGGPQEHGDRRQQGPEEQRDHPGQRTVGLAERGAVREEDAQAEGDDAPQHDGDRGTERQPRPRRLPATRAEAEEQRHARERQAESDRPGGDVRRPGPERAVDRAAQRPTEGEQADRHGEQSPDAHREEERAPVLLHGRAILLDAVDPVQPSLELSHRGGGGDEPPDRPERDADVVVVRAGLLRLVDRDREEVRDRARSRALDRPDDHLGCIPLSPNARARPTMAIMPWMAARVIMKAIDRAWLKPSANRSRWKASRDQPAAPAACAAWPGRRRR